MIFIRFTKIQLFVILLSSYSVEASPATIFTLEMRFWNTLFRILKVPGISSRHFPVSMLFYHSPTHKWAPPGKDLRTTSSQYTGTQLFPAPFGRLYFWGLLKK